MSNIYERIGQAITSNGEHDIVRAQNDEELSILKSAGFEMIGSVLEGGVKVPLFKVTQKTKIVEKIVQTPSTPWSNPPIDTSPWKITKPWDNTTQFPWTTNEPYRATFRNGTGDVDYLKYQGNTTSQMDAAYDPLSMLEDYFYTKSIDTPNTDPTFRILENHFFKKSTDA